MRVRILVLALIVAAGCGSDGTSPSSSNKKTHDIFTIGDAFSPSFEAVAPGDTVRWTFNAGSDQMGHNVRFTPAVAGAPSDIAVLKTGTAFRVFTSKGDFHYVCDVHPGMNGEIIVQ